MTSTTTRTARLVERPLSPSIGSEIHGIDLRDEQDDETIAWIRDALLRRKVIFFRDQDITSEQHIAFARRFGPLEIHPATPKDQEHREVLRIAHGPDSRGRENNWHSDVTWREEPSLGSVLRAIEVPEYGGDTLFANQYDAWDALPPSLKSTLAGRNGIHSARRGYARDGLYGENDKGRSMSIIYNDTALRTRMHPLARKHPETGRTALFASMGYTIGIEGLPEDEAHPLKHAGATLVAFVVAGAVPLVPYVTPFLRGVEFWASTLGAAGALFAVGAARTAVTVERWWMAGLEMLGLGIVVGAAAYGAGAVIAGVSQWAG